jgi:hypothetical protein
MPFFGGNGRFTCLLLLMLVISSGCSQPERPWSGTSADGRVGSARMRMAEGVATVDYWRDVKPILERRCVVCHGCYDAPCQLNLSAPQGIERGAHKKEVYDGSRLLAMGPTRLFEDGATEEDWRKKGFFPVLNPPTDGDSQARQAGVLAQMLALKRQHPLSSVAPLPASFDFSLDRAQQCPTREEFGDYARLHPLWGMPYGLPGLTDREHDLLMRWLDEGAFYGKPDPLPAGYAERIVEWEIFLNGDSLKQQVMSRYLYEHLALTSLYFDDLSHRQFFRLVRSRTPPGKPIDFIATRRPYDDPGVERVYYRLDPMRVSVLSKTHMPYELSRARRTRWTELFLNAPYEVRSLPGYQPDVASNPFIVYRDVPVSSRYRFLLDDAQTFVMQFIKGPVCRGQVALSVIEERFWIFFLDPDSSLLEANAEFLARESKHLRLPTSGEVSPLGVLSWLEYSRLQKEFLKAKQRYLEENRARAEVEGLKFVWNGDGRNPSAALTVLRHQDSASVVPGLVGNNPKTAWLVSYQLLERIHYLLVAGFDVFGNVGHQLDTRLYMDFLRMEAEFNFLVMLPKEVREKERDLWYRDAHQSVKDYVYGAHIDFPYESGIEYHTADPKAELFELLRTRLGGALDHRHDLASELDEDVRRPLSLLANAQGKALSWMPEVAFLLVTEGVDGDRPPSLYTVMHDAGLSNIAALFNEEKRRLPDEDRLTVTRGLVGAYPNAFYRVDRAGLPEFVKAVTELAGEEDYRRLAERFAVRRTDASFWEHSDRVHRLYFEGSPIEAGLFDYNRLENR